MLELVAGSMFYNPQYYSMSWIVYTYIHACVYTVHVLEMEDTCAIFSGNNQKNGVKGEVITKKDTKWFFKWFLREILHVL